MTEHAEAEEFAVGGIPPLPRTKIALCLSGGGFRATFFHLGVLRFLFRTKLVDNVTDIFAVSGGSILASHLAAHWDEYIDDFNRAATKLVRCGKSDLTGHVLRRLVFYWPWRTTVLERLYRRSLTGRLTLGELQSKTAKGRDRPRIHLLATSLTEGGPFCFGAEGFSALTPNGMTVSHRDNTGSIASFPVARAVAASSAIPPWFRPVKIRRTDLSDQSSAAEKFLLEPELSDGGVFDNVGLNVARRFSSRYGYSHIVVSDASAAFAVRVNETYGIASTMTRTTDILMHRVATLERNGVRPEAAGPKLTWLEIDSDLAQLRTDLDAFSTEEIRVLTWSGYKQATAAFPGEVADTELWDPCALSWGWLTRLRDLFQRPPLVNVAQLDMDLKSRAEALRTEPPRGLRLLRRAAKYLRRWLLCWRDWRYMTFLAVSLTTLKLFAPPLSGSSLRHGHIALSIDEDIVRDGGLLDASPPFALSPDGDFLVTVRRDPNTDGTSLYLSRLADRQDTLAIPGTAGAETPFFCESSAATPNTVTVLFAAGPSLFRIEGHVVRDSRVVWEVAEEICGNCLGVAVYGLACRDREIIVASSRGAGLWRVPASDSAPSIPTLLVAPPKDVLYRWPEILPNGDILLTSLAGASDRLLLWKRTGEFRVIASGSRAKLVDSGHVVFAAGGRLQVLDVDTKHSTFGEAPSDVSIDNCEPMSFGVSSSGMIACTVTANSLDRSLLVINPWGRWDKPAVSVVTPEDPGTFRAHPVFRGSETIAVTVGLPPNREVDVHRRIANVKDNARIPHTTFSDLTHPVWACDGATLVFRANGGRRGLYAVQSRDLEREKLGRVAPFGAATSGAMSIPFSWSPFGAVLVGRAESDFAPEGIPATRLCFARAVESVLPSCDAGTTYAAFSPIGPIRLACYSRGRITVKSAGEQVTEVEGTEPVWCGTKMLYRIRGQLQILGAPYHLELDPIRGTDYIAVEGTLGRPNYTCSAEDLIVAVGRRSRVSQVQLGPLPLKRNWGQWLRLRATGIYRNLTGWVPARSAVAEPTV
jgi:predicted acylesterase/phospholipase RssA